MEHKHNVTDQDLHFLIDPKNDMAITCEGKVKALKRGDHNSEVYSFSMPRIIEGHDMSLCNKVEIHYNNIHKDTSTRETTENRSFAEAEGFGPARDGADTVTWTWKPTGDATQLEGKLAFCVRFACMEGEIITYQKFSGIFEAIPVGDTIHNTEAVAREYADVLEAWRQEIIGACRAKEIDLLEYGVDLGTALAGGASVLNGTLKRPLDFMDELKTDKDVVLVFGSAAIPIQVKIRAAMVINGDEIAGLTTPATLLVFGGSLIRITFFLMPTYVSGSVDSVHYYGLIEAFG